MIRRKIGNIAPPSIYAMLYMGLSTVSPFRKGMKIKRQDDMWEIEPYFYSSIYAPDPSFARRVDRNGEFYFGYMKEERYTMDGEVDIDPGDIVVDVGACIGEFVTYAVKSANQVFAVEPDTISAKCLDNNIDESEDVTVIQKVAWKEDGKVTFHLSSDATENSIFKPDQGELINTVSLPAATIETIADKHEIHTIDFLKVDAEGAEPEVLAGIGDVDVQKLAVDCTPERDGTSPKQRVCSWLTTNDYTIKEKNDVLFGSK